MARPVKNTVDYFPHFIGGGKKIQYIETKYGNDGYATWFKILETLAETQYHFLNLNKDIDLMFLSAKCKVTIDTLISIIDDLATLNEINAEAWKHRIVWSEKFMESIKDAYKRRESLTHDFEGLCSILRGYCIHIDYNNPEKHDKNYGKERKGKEKEIKGEEIKVVSVEETSTTPTKKTIDERKIDFKNSIDPFREKYTSELLNSFYQYWIEKNENGKKMRFEMERVFDVGRRLSTWFNNENKFKKNENNKRGARHEPQRNITSYGKL